MELARKDIEDLKERLLDNWYYGMSERDLEIYFKDQQREYLDSIEDLEELIEMFEANGLLDDEQDND